MEQQHFSMHSTYDMFKISNIAGLGNIDNSPSPSELLYHVHGQQDFWQAMFNNVLLIPVSALLIVR